MSPHEIAILLKVRDQMSQALRTAGTALDRLAQSARRVDASGLERAGRAAQQAERQFSGLGRTASGLAGIFGRLGGGITGFVTRLGFAAFGLRQLAQTVGGLGNALFGFNARMEQTQVAFTGLLGSAERATAFMRELQALAARTPFEFPQLTSAAQKLIGVGVAAERVVPMMTAIGDAVAALGGSAFEIDRVTLALTQMLGKGKLSSQEMLQLTEANIPAWRLLAEELGVTTAELQQLAEKGAIPATVAVDGLVRAMERTFGGAMQQQARTFTGLVSTLRDNFNMALGRIMEPAFEAAKRQLERLVAFTDSPRFTAWAERMRDRVGEVAQRVERFLNEQGEDLVRTFGDAAGAALSLAQAVAQLAVEAGRLNDALGGEGFKTLLTLVALNKATGGVITGIATGAAAGATSVTLGRLLGGGAAAAGAAGAGAGGAALLSGTALTIGSIVITAGVVTVQAARAANETARSETPATDLARRIRGSTASDVPEIFGSTVGLWIQLIRDAGDEAETFTRQVDAATVALQRQEEAERRMIDAHGGLIVETSRTTDQVLNLYRQFADFDRMQAEVAAQARAVEAALGAVQQRSAELANVQFAVNDTIKIFSDQQSDYEAKVKAVEDAIEILQERQKRGIPLTAEESALLAHQDEILGRLKGGVEDATVAKGIAAGVSAELMKAQDELNAAIRDYGRDAPQALEAQQRYNEALDKARELGLDNAVAMSGNQQALADLTTVIEQRLVPQIYNLARALAPNSIPRDVQIEVQLADQIARQQLEALKQDIASGAVLPVSITTGTVGPGGGPQNRFAAGGTAREDMVALVGEQGPELVILPRGAHVIPTDQTRRLLRFAGAFADGGTIGGGAPGSTTLTLPNWDWLFAGLADAAAKWSKEAAEQVRQFLDAVQSGYETLRGAMTFSREFAAFQASGGSLPDAAALSPLVQLSEAVTTAFADSAAAFSAGRAKEWADTVRNFTDVASGGIQALSSMLKLLTELEDAPAFANDEATRERISALKFLTEHLAVSLGDSAAFIATHRPMDFGPLLKAFGEDVGPAIQALTDMLRLISELEDAPAFANDEATREQISQLKFLVEHLALSLGDTAAFVAASRPEQFTEELRSFSEDVAPGITALANLVELLHTLLDPDAPAFRNTPELRQHLTDLKFLVEHITLSLGDTAQFVQANRPAGFGAAMRTLGEDVVPGIRALAELVGLLRDLSDDTMPPAFTAGLFSGRIAALQVLFEDIAFALSDVATRIAQGRPADFAQQMTEQMDAVKSAIEAEREVLGLVNDLAQGTQLYLSPDRMRRRSEALADTVVLIATDLSAAADRLVQESPHILEKLETFSETIAPGVASVTEVVEGMEAIAGMSRISERQSRVFADNMERVAQMVEVGTDKLRRLDENGTLDDFRRIVLDLIGTLRTALAALGGGGTNSGAPQATPGVTVGGSATRVADVMAAYRDTTIRPAEAPVATVPSVTPQSGDARWQYGGAAHGPQTIIVNVGNEELERFVLRGMRRTVRLGVGGNVGV